MTSKNTPITIIDQTESLKKFCERMQSEEFITVDTEFIREKTYYPLLCLIQIAGSEEAVLIDPLADAMNLSPLFELMQCTHVTKVFHAATQDIEILYRLSGTIPTPLFDTQIAAMVCGFGEAVSYSKLVTAITGAEVDKTERFTNWSHRPLSQRQQHYALSDVTYLRDIYQHLSTQIDETNRSKWIEEEMQILKNPDLYHASIDKIWRKIRAKSMQPAFLLMLRNLCEWRENYAKQRDIPRAHAIKDHTLLEIAASKPTTIKELSKIRGIGDYFTRHPEIAETLLALIAQTMLEKPDRDLVKRYAGTKRILPKDPKQINQLELLKVLLKLKSAEFQVADRILCDNEQLAALLKEYTNTQSKHPCLTGWRYDIFGQYAVALLQGKIALKIDNNNVIISTDIQQVENK